MPTIRAASVSVNSVAAGSAGDELQIAVAAARLTTATAMMRRVTPPASARLRAEAPVSESRGGRQSRLRLAAFLGGVHAHLVLADDETVEPTFAIYLTGEAKERLPHPPHARIAGRESGGRRRAGLPQSDDPLSPCDRRQGICWDRRRGALLSEPTRPVTAMYRRSAGLEPPQGTDRRVNRSNAVCGSRSGDLDRRL